MVANGEPLPLCPECGADDTMETPYDDDGRFWYICGKCGETWRDDE